VIDFLAFLSQTSSAGSESLGNLEEIAGTQAIKVEMLFLKRLKIGPLTESANWTYKRKKEDFRGEN
jgi:hypothetical protein